MPQLNPTELVERFQIGNAGMRELLIRYLTRRSHTIDCVTLHGLTTVLCGTFWKAIERLNPSNPTCAWTRTPINAGERGCACAKTAGHAPAPTPCSSQFVPSTAIQAWAPESPDWAIWAAPCPIPVQEMRTREKRQRRVREQMADRTRTLQPLLPILVEHVDTELQNLTRLLAAATAAPPGEEFDVDSRRYRSLFTHADQQHERACGYANVRVHEHATDRARNLTLEEDTAFWQWAVIETLRQYRGTY